MVYRDLLPEREGGRFIASHITIADGGPVPDYVHHHDIRFQVIHCVRGWVRVVYEDQGEPFTMHAGDTVLQPPHIRHRVLESSPGLEVFEVTAPAEHPTFVEHDITLPTGAVGARPRLRRPALRPPRAGDGDVGAVARRAASRPPTPGIGAATGGLGRHAHRAGDGRRRTSYRRAATTPSSCCGSSRTARATLHARRRARPFARRRRRRRPRPASTFALDRLQPPT